VNIIKAAYKSSSLSKIIDEYGQLVIIHGSMLSGCRMAVYVHDREWKVRTLMTVKTAFAARTEKIAG
jgi:hypothetical protein